MALLRFLSSLLLVIATAAPLASATNSEGEALYAFRIRLFDPSNVLQSWDPTLVNPCTWFHVSCDNQNHVIRLDLGNSSISGSIVPELGRLKHLQYLELYRNNIYGEIPKELGNLKTCDVSNNNLCGTIPIDGPFAAFSPQSFANNSKINGPEMSTNRSRMHDGQKPKAP
ncbi:hypothetical protein HPP92_023675 [Vanilla planifolia]|uniref:Leucine-rich repeat-containing N-terminal plant-type domain-containing protein n=1 Tax=Vanilla planifolia TaxID=51239 RepID=A0A835PT98_VANPL|nr:hypothetical protein HPP92_023675 [Vanilla planifolia]